MSRTEKSAEAVVAALQPARAARPDGAGSLWQSEGPNERKGGTPANLEGVRRQKPRQLGLPLEARGEALRDRRSGETPTAANGNGRSGTDHLMEEVVERANARKAVKRVRQNKGSPGSDGMTVEELPAYLAQHWAELRAQLLAGTYQPAPVRRQAIPKADGGVRELGIPTALDRFVQQAILQVLQPRFDPTFSQHSHGFRPGRRAHDAVRAAQQYIQGGRRWVVDVDLEKFFDHVNHDVLMARLAKRVEDQRLLRLIRRYLEAGIMAHGVVVERHEGTPQGGPLSPILANVLLDEVDKELEKRGHAFARYADDCNVYVRSRRAGERVMVALRRLYARLRLRVNEAKSAVARPWTRKFLGYSFWVAPGRVIKRRVAAKALTAMRDRVRNITARNGGRSIRQVVAELRGYLVGWKEYFGLADTPRIFHALDEWIRHRLSVVHLKQWKRGRTTYRELRARGMTGYKAAIVAANTRRWWRNAGMYLHIALPNTYFDELGVPRLVS
jgi:RNA-directed DNA polymerase